MNRRRLLVLLVILGLLAGGVVHVPVARGTVGYGVFFEGHGSSYLRLRFFISGTGTFHATAWSVTVAGRTLDWNYEGTRVGFSEIAFQWLGAVGSGTFAASYSVTTNLGVMSGSGTVTLGPEYVSDTITKVNYTGVFGALPLSVSLSGAFTTQIGVPYTCTATGENGSPPYRYLFSIDWVTVIGGVNNYTAVYTGSITSSGTFTYTFTFTGEFLIRVTALDSTDAEATDTLDLNAGVNKPALWGQIYDIPDGNALYTYINFKLFPANVSQENPPVANGAIQTQFYEITSPGTVEKGSVYYMLSPVLITALPNPLLVYVNYHDPVSHADWSYVFSFNTTGWAANGGAASNGDTWTGAETPGAFAWLWDLLVKLFRYLFVPSSTDFSAQMASGWILIASPVPAITPQYTIPFPNPNHLLAPTGDSVDISFAGIQSYTGYSTYKAIVQAVLNMILLFVVISLVT